MGYCRHTKRKLALVPLVPCTAESMCFSANSPEGSTVELLVHKRRGIDDKAQVAGRAIRLSYPSEVQNTFGADQH